MKTGTEFSEPRVRNARIVADRLVDRGPCCYAVDHGSIYDLGPLHFQCAPSRRSQPQVGSTPWKQVSPSLSSMTCEKN